MNRVAKNFHESVGMAFKNPTLTDGETLPIREAIETLQSRLAAVPSLANLEVVLAPNAVAREAESKSACRCTDRQLRTVGTPVNLVNISVRPNMSLLLAARMINAIEESGASQTEVLAALGVVQCLLPTLGISPVSEDDVAHSALPNGC